MSTEYEIRGDIALENFLKTAKRADASEGVKPNKYEPVELDGHFVWLSIVEGKIVGLTRYGGNNPDGFLELVEELDGYWISEYDMEFDIEEDGIGVAP